MNLYCRKGLAGPDSPDLDDSYLGDDNDDVPNSQDQDYHSFINQQRNHLNLQIPPSLQNFRLVSIIHPSNFGNYYPFYDG